jgi:hypothetical protein
VFNTILANVAILAGNKDLTIAASSAKRTMKVDLAIFEVYTL